MARSIKPPTPSQHRIINHPWQDNTILKVIAGPGSGKTYTLVQRIAHAIASGVDPEHIVALSMSNRSVDSLRASLSELVGEDVTSKVTIRTFHGFCGNLLENYAKFYLPSYSRVRIIDDMAWRHFSGLFSSKTISVNGKKIKGTLSAPALEKLLEDIRTNRTSVDEAASRYAVSKEYLQALLQYLEDNGMMRYHDIISNALAMMRVSQSPHEMAIPQLSNYQLVVVDEFQDMYPQLLDVVRAVVQYDPHRAKHLTIAGDPNQSIYEFLGSSPNLLHDFQRLFGQVHVDEITIHECFRCSEEILRVATDACPQDLTAVRQAVGFVPVRVPHRPDRAARDVAFEIARLVLELGGTVRPTDIAVLARSNREVNDIHLALQQLDIDARKLGLATEWTKSRLHVLMELLNVLVEGPGCDLSLLFLISALDTHAGAKARVAKLFNLSGPNKMEPFLAQGLDTHLHGIYRHQHHQPFLEKVNGLLTSIRDQRHILATLGESPSTVTQSLLDMCRTSGLLDYINLLPEKRTSSSQTRNPLVNMQQWLAQFGQSLTACFQKYATSASELLFTDYFLRTHLDDFNPPNVSAVNLSTVHTAKGLEFPIVFLYGSSWNGVIDQTTSDPRLKRLFYVGATRARNLLYVTHGPDPLPGHNNHYTLEPPPVDGKFLRLFTNDSHHRPLAPEWRRNQGRLLSHLAHAQKRLYSTARPSITAMARLHPQLPVSSRMSAQMWTQIRMGLAIFKRPW